MELAIKKSEFEQSLGRIIEYARIMSNAYLNPPGEIDLSLRHLEAELVRLDILLHREVKRWQLADQDAGDELRGRYITGEEAEALIQRPFGASWGQMIIPAEEETQAYAEGLAQVKQHVQAIEQEARARGHRLRLHYLAETFGLNRFEQDALLICLAPVLDLSYGRVYSYLQDDVMAKRPTVNLVLDLLARPGLERLLWLRCFEDGAPLMKYQVLERVHEVAPAEPPLLEQSLYVDKSITAWLLGQYQPHAKLGSQAALFHPTENEGDMLLAADARPALAKMISYVGRQSLLAFHGADLASQKAAARLIAAWTGQSLLMVNLEGLVKEGVVPPVQLIRLALRDARLVQAIPCLLGWDIYLKQGGLLPEALAELCDHPNLVIVASKSRWHAHGLERSRPLIWQEFPSPGFPQRRALWSYFLKGITPAEVLDIAGVAGQFSLATDQIRDSVIAARDLAAQAGRPLKNQDLFSAARNHSSPALAELARKIIPRYTLNDIILPEDQMATLYEILATVRGRPRVLDEWKVGQKLASSNGITVLFAGPPGTGKTMAAEVIANELQLDLYKIDLTTVISKYIGDTEKNLERIFKEAENSNAILFFDEADAIFGKRSEVKDAHDRYANIEVSYLLQRMEAYSGVTILATNLRANLDTAFMRRLQFALDLPFPEDEQNRLHIWLTLFPETIPRAPDLDLALFARRFRLSGGNIRNIINNAAYLAAADGGRVTMEHLLHSTRRELQKMGRLIDKADLTLENLSKNKEDHYDSNY
jgi:AAA+ superfamily predicted ATPase